MNVMNYSSQLRDRLDTVLSTEFDEKTRAIVTVLRDLAERDRFQSFSELAERVNLVCRYAEPHRQERLMTILAKVDDV